MPSIQQRVAVKIFSEKFSQTDALTETKITFEMSCHPNFAYVFGIIEPNKLLMENIGCETLSKILKNKVLFQHGKGVCLDLVGSLQNIHNQRSCIMVFIQGALFYGTINM